ncbi:LPXTG-site transpeptidase (sortase) family protein [Nocardioides exalbidus]|uniref:LPXTG-site transpeptidase (Sortase) family protein n=1 Tax=Nocardioides exalbidus TaxID=402596 RepID=A0A1H4LPI5_9ACTN|nr:class E sortase [Nocardioides exalbidus]SEB72547.1 LPXTG-site transpeptidase (sortase) family protein [Nocardioides exalbidus]
MTMTTPRPTTPASPAGGTAPAVKAPAARRTEPRPAPSQGDDLWSVVSTTSVMVCLVAGWMVAQMLYLGGLAQDRAQDELYTEFRAELAAGTAPIGPVTEVGKPVATLSIPHIGVDQVVVEGTASGDLLDGPGHLRNTVLPGQEGTSAVFGRASTYGAPFARIGDLVDGDQINVTTAQGEVRFRVIGVRRAGDPLPQPRPDGAARLVLVSGEASGSRLPSLSPGQVVYVDAEADEAFQTPAGLPRVVPEPEQAMGTESGAVMPLLTLCLGLLLALTLGVIAARQRFSTALVWVVTTPVVIAVAWLTTDVVMRLLPNLM